MVSLIGSGLVLGTGYDGIRVGLAMTIKTIMIMAMVYETGIGLGLMMGLGL